MAIREKYNEVISLAQASGVSDLKVNEQNNVLYVTGTASSEEVKRSIWAAYEKVDPDMRAGDMVLDISVTPTAGQQTYTVKSGDSLSKIAGNYNGITWQQIFEANKDQISNPDLIHPGQVLKIPSKA